MSKPKQEMELDVPEALIWELLTPSEIRMIKSRWRIIEMLRQGIPVRHIASVARVGTDTVVRMSKKLRFNPKLRHYFHTRDVVRYSSSRWVFGQVGKKETN